MTGSALTANGNATIAPGSIVVMAVVPVLKASVLMEGPGRLKSRSANIAGNAKHCKQIRSPPGALTLNWTPVEEEVLGKAYDSRLMKRLLTYMRPYRTAVAASLVFLLVNSVLQILGPLLTKMAVDRYLAPNPRFTHTLFGGWFSANPWTGLMQISILYLLAVIGALLCDFAQSWLMQWTGQKAMFDLRRQLMQRLQELDIAHYDRNPVGRMVTRVTTDVDVLNDLFASGLVTIIGDLLMLAFVVLAMLRLSPGMTGMLLAATPFVVLTTTIFRRAVQQSYRRIRVAIARINSYLQEHISGMTVLQLFNREERSRQEFEAANRAHMDAFKDSITAYGWFYPVVEFIGMIALAALLSYGGVRIRGGALSLGVLVAFFQYGMRFFRPIQDLSEKYNILQAAMAASERIFRLLDTEPVIVSPPAPQRIPEGDLLIEFDRVWFAYRDEEWVLRDVSFRIEPGETIAVVGHTGAGKTTLTNLLLRFYDIQRGSIRIGGRDIREFPLEELRRNFSIVLQDPYLFTGTIGSNIRLGADGNGVAAVEQAAAQMNLLGSCNNFDTGTRRCSMEDLPYPIGKFQFPQAPTARERQPSIHEIAEAPAKFRAVPHRPSARAIRSGKRHFAETRGHVSNLRECM